MSVNETLIAQIRPKPDPTMLKVEPDEAVAAAKAAVEAPAGIGSIASFATEVPLPPTGTWTSAGKGGARADAVLVAPEAGCVTGIDWVIAGGESGPRFRPMQEEWVTGIRDTCADAGVAFFFKLLCTKSEVTAAVGDAQ